MVVWASVIFVASIAFACVSAFYIPLTVGGQIMTFGKVGGKVIGDFFQWGPIQIAIYVILLVWIVASLLIPVFWPFEF